MVVDETKSTVPRRCVTWIDHVLQVRSRALNQAAAAQHTSTTSANDDEDEQKGTHRCVVLAFLAPFVKRKLLT